MIRIAFILSALFSCTFLVPGTNTAIHDGPDPVVSWYFNQRSIDGQSLKARLGPDAIFATVPKIIADEMGQSVFFDGMNSEATVAADHSEQAKYLPTRSITVSTWVAIDKTTRWGGIVGVVQDNNDAESGWVLGYDENNFTFALASKGSDDGNGLMTYLAGQTRIVPGKFYHVVGVYDGETTQLYVNGKLDGSSDAQSGDILYPEKTPWVIGAYRDDNEFHPMQGRIREIAIYDLAAKAEWVAEEFAHQKKLIALPALSPDVPLEFVVQPFLQYGTQDGMTVVWQTTATSSGRLHWGETDECKNAIDGTAEATIHQIRIDRLKPETQYFYRVESKTASGESINSEIQTFQTASLPETPFAFAVISDTQGNPAVSGTFAEMAWAQRPNFLLHPGDLVDTGSVDRQWTHQFFSSMEPLISRVPLFPVLGNHEQNARNYFDYMALPDPEYYYQFSYGNTGFFMIDSNRNVDPGSEQYVWLEQALAKSTSTWKVVCHHHPPFSSDENDYGNLWKTNHGTRGDERIRQLVPLYEKHGVDIVWNGHIHSYERTWPVREGRAVNKDGTIYMITGGGGGGLETAGPYRPWFQNNVRRGHHYCMVHVNGNTIEIKSFGLDGELFDYVQLDKDK